MEILNRLSLSVQHTKHIEVVAKSKKVNTGLQALILDPGFRPSQETSRKREIVLPHHAIDTDKNHGTPYRNAATMKKTKRSKEGKRFDSYNSWTKHEWKTKNMGAAAVESESSWATKVKIDQRPQIGKPDDRKSTIINPKKPWKETRIWKPNNTLLT